LRLELGGFTAFREPQVISFEDLDLFVISGPTGAGKTSLLDAMSYVLFGEVPRMGARGLTDLISQGLTEARISLEFSSGDDRYRVARRLRRTGASSATFERLDGEDWLNDVEGSGVRAVDRRIVELLKLDFDAFTRAVVLPQGEFQRFLRGDVGERRQILIALLGLDHYMRMGARARARASELEVSVETTQQILTNQYADATAEAVQAAEGIQEQATKRAEQLTKALTTAAELDGQATDLRTTQESLVGVIAALSETATALEEKAETCQEAKEKEESLGTALSKAKTRGEKARTTLEKAKNDSRQRVEQYGTLEELLRAEGAVETRKQCMQDLTEKQARIKGLADELKTLAERADKAEAKVDELKSAQETLRGRVKEAATKSEQAKDGERTLAVRVTNAETKTDEIGKLEEELERCSELLTEATAAKTGAKKAADAADAEYRRLSEEQMATALARDLKAGEPCPVCHRLLEAAPDVDEHIAEALGAAEKARQQAREHLDSATETESTARTAHKNAELLLRDAHNALAEALQKIKTLELLQEALVTARSEAETCAERLSAVQGELESVGEALSQAQVAAASLKSSIEEKTTSEGQLTGETDQLQERVDTATAILAARFAKEIPADVANQLARRREAVEAAEDAVDNAQQEFNDAQDALQEANEAVGELQRELSELDSAIATLGARCQTNHEAIVVSLKKLKIAADAVTLPRAIKAREEHVSALLDWCGTVAGVLNDADGQCARSLGSLDGELAALLSEYKLQAAETETPLQTIKAVEQQAREEMIRCEEVARQAVERLQQREELTASIAEKQSVVIVLKALSAELRADRFVQFIIQQTLDLLAVRASDELLRISAERYSLISHDGEFYVIDHVNADEQRSVKTLSGGETFLASLSLALALSQHVGDLAAEGMGAKLEAVFIDEGFGALDPETLEDVIDALERLREGNLMVGVITHVPALAERIRVGVRVDKGENQSQVVVPAG
jgi:DNA repair protein SbcC/Rad50